MGQTGVGDKALDPVEHVGPAPLASPQPDRGRVRPGIRLGQGEGSHVPARGESRQVPALLVRRSRHPQRVGGKRLHREQGIRQRGHPRQGLADHAQVPDLHAAAYAAEPARRRMAENAARRQPPEHRHRGLVAGFRIDPAQLGLRPRGHPLPQTKLRRAQAVLAVSRPEVAVHGSRHPTCRVRSQFRTSPHPNPLPGGEGVGVRSQFRTSPSPQPSPGGRGGRRVPTPD